MNIIYFITQYKSVKRKRCFTSAVLTAYKKRPNDSSLFLFL